MLSLQLCPTLCGPMDCRPPGSSVHGISQARIWEWVVISWVFIGRTDVEGETPILRPPDAKS